MNMAHWKYPLSSADPAVVAESVKGMRNQPAQRALLGRRNGAAGAGRGQSADQLPGGLDALQTADPQADPTGGGAEGHHRDRGSVEQVSAQPARIRRVTSTTSRAPGSAPISMWATWCSTAIRRIGFAPWASASRSCTSRTSASGRCRPNSCRLREGDIDWPEVHKALGEIGYHGTATVELEGGDEAYLREVNRRFELILSGV